MIAPIDNSDRGRTLMKNVKITGLILAVALAAPTLAKAEHKIIDRVKVGDGGFDYATFNPATNQVLMARTDYTTVIDVKTHKVSELKSAIRAHSTLPVPGTTLAVLPQRKGSIDNGDQGTIRIIDLAGKLEFVASDSAGKVYVIDESPLPNTNIAVLDAKAYTVAPNRYPLA